MLVTADRSLGQVGGGRVEAAAIRKARELLGTRNEPVQEDVHVVRDLGMSCGGSMTLLYEPMSPPERLVVFGAGHVSRALTAVAAAVGFDVTVFDERREWLVEEAFPGAVGRVLVPWPEAVERARIDEHTLVASVSPGHAVDQVLVRAIYDAGVRPKYLGVIGSVRKGILFKRELIESGVPEEWVNGLRIPMGVRIGAVEPGEIAVSIAAELVSCVRGAPMAEWHEDTTRNDD